VDVETKEQSKQCMHTHSPGKPTISNKHCLLARKLMATVFWDRKGVLTVEFMQQGIMISSEVYCETVKKCIGLAIHNKRHGMLTYSVVLLHDNVCPHTAAHT
jgi:hypothetical protein